MTKRYKEIAIILIIVGVIGFSLASIFGQEVITLISEAKTNGITYYKIDVWAYLDNIQVSIGQTSYLQLTTQSRSWVNITSNIVQQQFWEDLGNNMAVILNWIIYGLNILIYPFRIGGYVFKQTLVILGFNVDSQNNQYGISWIVELANWLVKDAFIRYV